MYPHVKFHQRKLRCLTDDSTFVPGKIPIKKMIDDKRKDGDKIVKRRTVSLNRGLLAHWQCCRDIPMKQRSIKCIDIAGNKEYYM